MHWFRPPTVCQIEEGPLNPHGIIPLGLRLKLFKTHFKVVDNVVGRWSTVSGEPLGKLSPRLIQQVGWGQTEKFGWTLLAATSDANWVLQLMPTKYIN